jgi:hypothetical protein
MKATVGDAGPDEMKDGMGKADKLLLAKQAKLLLSVIFSTFLDSKYFLLYAKLEISCEISVLTHDWKLKSRDAVAIVLP